MTNSKLAIVLCALAGMCGCDDWTEISRVPNRDAHKEVRSVSCSYYGFCYGCGLGFDGKMDCGYKYRSCGGSREALMLIDHDQVTYKNGRHAVEETQRIIEYKSECQ